MGRPRKIKLIAPMVEQAPIDPLSIIHEDHIEKYGWGGSCIRAYRVSKNMTRWDLARKLHIRDSKLTSYESEKRNIGIKFAKMLGEIFKVDWHIFRKNPKEKQI